MSNSTDNKLTLQGVMTEASISVDKHTIVKKDGRPTFQVCVGKPAKSGNPSPIRCHTVYLSWDSMETLRSHLDKLLEGEVSNNYTTQDSLAPEPESDDIETEAFECDLGKYLIQRRLEAVESCLSHLWNAFNSNVDIDNGNREEWDTRLEILEATLETIKQSQKDFEEAVEADIADLTAWKNSMTGSSPKDDVTRLYGVVNALDRYPEEVTFVDKDGDSASFQVAGGVIVDTFAFLQTSKSCGSYLNADQLIELAKWATKAAAYIRQRSQA